MREIAASLPPIAAMASPDVHRVLALEEILARDANRPAPTLEDLLHAIALDPVGAHILRSSGANTDLLSLALAREAARTPSSTPDHDFVLRWAQLVTKIQGREQVSLATLSSSMFMRPKSRSVRLLAKYGATALDVRRFLAHGTVKAEQRSWLPIARVVRDRPIIRTARCKVVFVNDDFTSRETVVKILQSLFDHPPEQAERIATLVQDEGRFVIGDYPAGKAHRLAARARRRAEKKDYPLLVILEPCGDVTS
jgi:ATP-dependent Clp protease adaptor protein ClpS